MRRNRSWKQSRWVERSNRNNPRHKDYDAPINLDEIVESNDSSINNGDNEGFWNYTRRVARNIFSATPTPVKAGMTGLVALFLVACGGGSSTVPETPTTAGRSESNLEATVAAATQLVMDGMTIKYNETDSNGNATFKDSTTGEILVVEVVDASSRPLSGMQVQYFDSKDVEGFIVKDPTNHYAPSFRVLQNNIETLITTYTTAPSLFIPITMQTSGPQIRIVEELSPEKKAIDRFVKQVEDDWVYIDRLTPKQLDALDSLYSIIVGWAGINTSVISDVIGKIRDISYSDSGWREPPFYDVYEVITKTNRITTTIRVLVPVQSPKSKEESVALEKDKPNEEATVYEIPKIPDGSKVVFTQRENDDMSLYLINASTKEVFQLTSGSSRRDDVSYHDPDLSPDGNLIVYSFIGRNYRAADVVLLDIKQRTTAELTSERLGGENASWSNDGRNIVFRRAGEIYFIDLYQSDCKLNLDQTRAALLPQAFSPDDSQILYHKGYINPDTGQLDESRGIWITNSDGSNPHQFKGIELSEETGLRRGFLDFDWSIDGKIAALMEEYNENTDEIYRGIVTMDSDGSNLKKITWGYSGSQRETSRKREELHYSKPTWSQDGKFLFYKQGTESFLFGYDGDDLGLFVTNIETGETLDVRTFEWTTIEAPLTQVGLDDLLKTKGKQPYDFNCIQDDYEEKTFERNIDYRSTMNVDGVQYDFDGDRVIGIRVTYDPKHLREYARELDVTSRNEPYMLDENVSDETIYNSITISSTDLKNNHTAVITRFESALLDSLKKLGVSSVDVLYFREGNMEYTN